MKYDTLEYTLPAYWAPYLINDDPSGLENSEIAEIDTFLKDKNLPGPVGVSEESEFKHSNDANNLGADCLIYSFLVPKTYFAQFNYIGEIELSATVINDCPRHGDCGPYITGLDSQTVKDQLNKIDPEKLKKELKEYGAWSDAELNNHSENLTRILWIAIGDISDSDEYVADMGY